MKLFVFFCLFLLVSLSAFAGEFEETSKELQAVQARIAEEEARYQAAKAQMERAAVIAQYVFPELRAKEKQLLEKLQSLSQTSDPDKTAKAPKK